MFSIMPLFMVNIVKELQVLVRTRLIKLLSKHQIQMIYINFQSHGFLHAYSTKGRIRCFVPIFCENCCDKR